MALWDEVTTRLSSRTVVALTNPDDPTATSVDTARANAAVTDVQAAFEIFAQVVYDNDNALHVAVAIGGVEAYLIDRGAAGSAESGKSIARFHKQLERLARATTRRRMLPATNSELVPTDEFDGVTDVKPDFDRKHFDGYQLDNPSAGIDDLDVVGG